MVGANPAPYIREVRLWISQVLQLGCYQPEVLP